MRRSLLIAMFRVKDLSRSGPSRSAAPVPSDGLGCWATGRPDRRRSPDGSRSAPRPAPCHVPLLLSAPCPDYIRSTVGLTGSEPAACALAGVCARGGRLGRRAGASRVAGRPDRSAEPTLACRRLLASRASPHPSPSPSLPSLFRLPPSLPSFPTLSFSYASTRELGCCGNKARYWKSARERRSEVTAKQSAPQPLPPPMSSREMIKKIVSSVPTK